MFGCGLWAGDADKQFATLMLMFLRLFVFQGFFLYAEGFQTFRWAPRELFRVKSIHSACVTVPGSFDKLGPPRIYGCLLYFSSIIGQLFFFWWKSFSRSRGDQRVFLTARQEKLITTVCTFRKLWALIFLPSPRLIGHEVLIFWR